MLKVSRGDFRKYLKNKDKPWKYEALAEEMRKINSEDECNDTYDRIRMFQALSLKNPEGVKIPSERTVYRVIEEIGLSHKPKRKPLAKAVTDITEIKCKDGKLYTLTIFDCYDLSVLGLAMDTNMKAPLCVQALKNPMLAYPELKGCIIHSDRGTQYTSELYRKELKKYKIIQSMNSDGERCHDNTRCKSIWARMKSELLYDRYNTEKMTVEEVKILVCRYFICYWNNRRICSANGGLTISFSETWLETPPKNIAKEIPDIIISDKILDFFHKLKFYLSLNIS